MIKTKLAKKLLTKKEQKHLTEVGIDSMRKMKNQMETQIRFEPDHPSSVCFDCWHIGRKLGIFDGNLKEEKDRILKEVRNGRI